MVPNNILNSYEIPVLSCNRCAMSRYSSSRFPFQEGLRVKHSDPFSKRSSLVDLDVGIRVRATRVALMEGHGLTLLPKIGRRSGLGRTLARNCHPPVRATRVTHGTPPKNRGTPTASLAEVMLMQKTLTVSSLCRLGTAGLLPRRRLLHTTPAASLRFTQYLFNDRRPPTMTEPQAQPPAEQAPKQKSGMLAHCGPTSEEIN